MRKILSLLLLVLPLSAAFAQPTYSNLDTVSEIPSHYYVPSWYTRCHSFRADTAGFYDTGVSCHDHNGLLQNIITAREFRTDTLRPVYGMVALVEIDPLAHHQTIPVQNSSAGRAPEYLKLLQGTDPIVYYPGGDTIQTPLEDVFPRQMTVLDSLRWDTVTPRILRLPKNIFAVDDTDFFYCYAYECWFPQPVNVDSVFYVLGTYRSNLTTLEGYLHYPTSYFYIREKSDIQCNRCTEEIASKVFTTDNFPNQFPFQWHQDDMSGAFFGLFYPFFELPEAK
ncbi:MAG: hypothetical protein IJ524_07765 [Bacteroidales bacterium]|nr:hypothetical protein [Bacteroidales bacterium]